MVESRTKAKLGMGQVCRLAPHKAEEWPSGLRRRSRKAVGERSPREFKSHLLRFVRGLEMRYPGNGIGGSNPPVSIGPIA